MIIELRTKYVADGIIQIVHRWQNDLWKIFVFWILSCDITENYLVHGEEFSRVFLIYRNFT